MMIKPVYTIPGTAPIKFYKFLIKFSLPLGIIMGTVNFFIYAADKQYWIEALFTIVHVFLLFFSVYNLRNWKWSGVCALYADLILMMIYNLIGVTLNFRVSSEISSDFASKVCASATLLLLYWIYFSKRRMLFTPVPSFCDCPIHQEDGDHEGECPTVDNESRTQLDALSTVQRSARAAEKRLNATEAEMRFASDIAAGIYTIDMIPAAMDADKILELTDCYIAERAFKANDTHPQINTDLQQKNVFADPSNNSDYIPCISDDKLLNTVAQMRTLAMSSADTKSETVPDNYPVSPPKAPVPPSSNLVKKFLPWVPSLCVLISFVFLCAYCYNPDIFFLKSSDDPVSSESSNQIRGQEENFDEKERQTERHLVKIEYVGSVNSDFIHYTTCPNAKNIKEKNRVYYKNLSDALADGRIKCSTCFSDSSSSNSSTSAKSSSDSFTQRYIELRKQRQDDPLLSLRQQLERARRKYGVDP